MTVIDLARAEGKDGLRMVRNVGNRIAVDGGAPLVFRIRSDVPKAGAWTLRGEVSLPSPIPGAPVQAMRGRRRLDTSPDGDLVFAATGLPPGRHRVDFRAMVDGQDGDRSTQHQVSGTLELDVI